MTKETTTWSTILNLVQARPGLLLLRTVDRLLEEVLSNEHRVTDTLHTLARRRVTLTGRDCHQHNHHIPTTPSVWIPRRTIPTATASTHRVGMEVVAGVDLDIRTETMPEAMADPLRLSTAANRLYHSIPLHPTAAQGINTLAKINDGAAK